MPIDNNYYRIHGTELGEIQATLQTVANGNMPTEEEALDMLAYVQQAFQQPVTGGGGDDGASTGDNGPEL